MCGILGICSSSGNVGVELYLGLNALQHRGQDSAGIITYSQKYNLKKGNGLVRQIFNEKNMGRLVGNLGIGHVRYPTVGGGGADDAQPFYVNSPFGLALAHNGNLVNYAQLKEELFSKDFRHLNSNCDGEVLLNVFADELMPEVMNKFSAEAVFNAIKRLYKRVEGSYSAVAIIADKGLVAFRDPYGIKPLIMGKKGDDYAFASESAALDIMGFDIVRDVMPGEVVFVEEKPTFFNEGRKLYSKRLVTKPPAHCIFEWVYFARPDSVIDGINVYEARFRLGLELAKVVEKKDMDIDVVVPIPDTARPAASALAEKLKLPLREGLIKNRYIGRTFIMPDQAQRAESVRQKLNPIRSEIEGKKILLVDDSIVRGTTSRELVNLIRSVGAKKVYFGVYSPPLRYPCVYGIDMQTKGEFIARNRNEAKIAKEIGADDLCYQTLEGLIRAVYPKGAVCTACFTGNYPTNIPEKFFKQIEKERLEVKGCGC